MRGIGPVRVLQEIEARTSRNIWDIFSLIGGTSTGGIVGCLAGAGVPMVQARKFYYENGPCIFRSSLRRVTSGGGLFSPRYDSADLQAALSSCLGSALMREAKTKVMVTTIDDLANAEMVKSWDPEWEDCPLSVAALMTASAQTYFSPARLMHEGKVQYYLDGGNVRNSPMACVLAEAVRLWFREGEDILIVHLGTGREREPRRLPHGGGLAWAPRVFEATTQADDSYDNYFVETFAEVLPQIHYCRFDFTMPELPGLDAVDSRTLGAVEDAAWHAVLREWKQFEKLIEELS